MTIEELRKFLTEQYKTFVRNPQVYIRPVAYRPVRIYVGGEVKRPGYYTLMGVQSITKKQDSPQLKQDGLESMQTSIGGGSLNATMFPLRLRRHS